jgi:hypothetical protein
MPKRLYDRTPKALRVSNKYGITPPTTLHPSLEVRDLYKSP